MSESVNEATIALKGLLGIHPGTEIIKAADKDKGANKRKKNKKKPNSEGASTKNSSAPTVQAVKANASKGNESSKLSSDQKKDKKDSIRSSSSSKTTENFAWSAFQSPPDPSTLPLPSFQGHDDDILDESKFEEKNKSERNVKDPIPPDLNVTPTLSTIKVKALLSISTSSISDSSAHISAIDENRTVLDSQSKDNDTGVDEKPSADAEISKPMSQSGVNLAKLTMKCNEHIAPQKPSNIEQTPYTTNLDPIAVLLKGESYGITNPALENMQATNPQHHLQYFGQPYGYMQPYDRFAPNPTMPVHPMYQPPPPFTTIQVQVPPVLLPGNQMILPASPLTGGYPLPITLPDNAQPGMIVPVTIPHMPHMPYPLHFMNVNVPSPHSGMMSNLSQNYYSQHPQNSFEKVDNRVIDSSGIGERKPKSWAERVADKSNSMNSNKKTPK